jgi:hypothetical protein
MALHVPASLARVRALHRIIVAGIVGLVVLAGCQPARSDNLVLPANNTPVEPTTEAALRFVEKVSAAGKHGLESGQASLTISQQEVTSFLSIGSQIARQLHGSQLTAERLADLQDIEGLDKWKQLAQERQGLPPIRLPGVALRVIFAEPQVYFTGDGEIALYGYLRLLRWQLPVHLSVAPRASQGELVLDFVSGSIGPIRLPELLFDPLGKALAQLILSGQALAEITEIRVDAGQMTIAGQYHRDKLGF